MYNWHMAKKKFATKVSAEVLKDLREYAEQSQLSISDVVDEALKKHLQNVHVRPAFRSAAAQVIESHSELLELLAK